jgi:hypothetical protein
MDSQHGYTVGDFVIVSHPAGTTDYIPGEDTFKVVGFTTNYYGQPLVLVVNIRWPDNPATVFYPHELSWEDGSRP